MMKPGDIVLTTYIRNVFAPDPGWDGYKANKGYVMVFAYLGAQPKDGSGDLDVEKRLNELGWVKKDGHSDG
jgi:hypothetical protein